MDYGYSNRKFNFGLFGDDHTKMAEQQPFKSDGCATE